jgi:two-component system, OmpR family, phosphate regulon sensor histidine kinase PhoR
VPDLRLNAFLYVVALSTICAFLWLIVGANIALIVFSLGLLLYLAHHITWLNQLYSWFKNPEIKHIPEGSGAWEDVFTALLQYARSNLANQTQLSSALERFNLTANAIPDGLVILGASNEIEWCTSCAEIQLGLNFSTDKNLPIVNLVRDSHFIAYLYNNDFDEPFKLKSWQNPDLTFEIQLISFGASQKLLICRDTTQLEKVEVMRRDFIANVSHELRTPLTVVGGFLETLGDMQGAVPDAIKGYFGMMQDQTVRMRRIIEDLLTLSKIESNIEEPENHEINMAKLLSQIQSDALGLSHSLYKTKRHIQLTADQNLNLNGSQDELQSAMSNLVSNAVRYTPKGGEIAINWYLQDEHAVFSVRDSGIGIEPQHIDRLTERFYRVDRGRSRETGGTGLGLSIVKHILIRHQAKLEITSEIGLGSTFSILFPKSRVVINSTNSKPELIQA